MTGDEGISFARFGFEKVRITANRVHRKLFEPRKDGTLSVYAIDELSPQDILAAGERTATHNQKILFGWATITRPVVEAKKLTLWIDNHPYCRHATISGWPEDRSACLETQQFLAANCSKVMAEDVRKEKEGQQEQEEPA